MRSGALSVASAAPGIAPKRDARSTALLALTYAVVLALLAWPLVSVTNPLLADYPNHLARQFVADQVANSETLARYYFVRDVFYPYQAMDLIVGLLRPLLGLEGAGKAFLILSALMPMAGVVALSRALHGRIGLWPIVSALFAYNLLLSWGFTTYLFSVGLALMGFAGWIATERLAWLPRLAVFSVVSVVIFCAHPFGFGGFALLVGGWELGRTPAWSWHELRQTFKRLCLAGLQFIPALLIAGQIQGADFGNDATEFGSVKSRLVAWLSPTLFVIHSSEFAVTGVLLLAFGAAMHKGLLAFDRRMAWPLGTVALAAALMPQTLSGIYLVHMRLPLLLVLLLIGSYRVVPQPSRIVAVAAAIVATTLLFRTTVAADKLAVADQEIAELRAAGAALEEGARILPVLAEGNVGTLRPYHYWHAAAYLTIDRSAFYPLLFSFFNIDVVPASKSSAAPATSPVAFDIFATPPGERERVRPRGQPRYWANWRQAFDYVIVFDFGQPVGVVPEGLSLVRRGAVFSLYKTVK
jgi:hypothetical protein